MFAWVPGKTAFATPGAALRRFFVFEQFGKFSKKYDSEIDRRTKTMGLLNKILDLLYPPRCVMCHGLLEPDFSLICPTCEKAIHHTCNGGARTGIRFSVCVSPVYYQDVVRDAVIHLKFHGKTAGVPLFASWMAACVQENLANCYDLVTWVPVSRRRLRKRGYDQARLLAEAMAAQLEKPLVRTLVKRVHNPAQSGIADSVQRAENVRNVYALADPRQIAGKRILLVDDVITTGATLESSASVLKDAGAVSVLCCTLACTTFSEQKQEFEV
jgi:competence protein ComFC